MPEGPDYERLEPSSREQKDARRPHVLVHGDGGGAPRQRHCLHTGLLPQPVSNSGPALIPKSFSMRGSLLKSHREGF